MPKAQLKTITLVRFIPNRKFGRSGNQTHKNLAIQIQKLDTVIEHRFLSNKSNYQGSGHNKTRPVDIDSLIFSYKHKEAMQTIEMKMGSK